MGQTVAIVGRPNVGKSTLFNRLLGQRKAIIDDTSGVTRDRQYGISHWNGKDFNIIDTGGFVPNSDDVFEKAIRQQVQIAIDEASIIMFVVDVVTGITDLDMEVARMLRKTDKPVYLVVNKVDNHQRSLDAAEFYSLGLENLFSISSISGSGTGELLDGITAIMPDEDEEVIDGDIPKLAIVGRPNVGKSSLLNAFIGKDRNIVTDIAGTTRDSIHTHYKMFQKDLLLIDTAGIRKKTKVHENIEFYSVIRAIKAIDESDVVILVVDATQGLESQDINVLRLAERKKKGLVIVVNKWDIVEGKDSMSTKEFDEKIHRKTAPFTDVPIIYTSATEKKRIMKVLETALEVYDNRKQKIATSKLNDVMLKAIEAYHPPANKGKFIKIKYVTQLPTQSPTFAFFCNHPQYIKEPYRNYLENKMRATFNLTGVPLRLIFRDK